MWQDFKAFIMRGNVLELAVAVVIGAAFGVVVKSFTDDVLMPPIGLALGHVDFSNLYVLLKDGAKAPAPYASLADARAAGATVIAYGLFVNNVVNFLIVAFAIFLVVRAANRAYRRPEATPTTRPCPFCATQIPIPATRCPNCTSQLAAA